MSWERHTAARTLAQEARNQPLAGQQAVAWTFRNRLADGRWGKSLASVCLWHAAYSGWWCPRGKPSYHDPNFAYACGLQDNDPLLLKLLDVVNAVMVAAQETDPSQGATHYFATSIAAPGWVTGDPEHGIPAATFTVQIGAHRFYKGVK